MATIRFDRHPAYVTVGDGLSMAASFWAASPEQWIIPVVAVALVKRVAARPRQLLDDEVANLEHGAG